MTKHTDGKRRADLIFPYGRTDNVRRRFRFWQVIWVEVIKSKSSWLQILYFELLIASFECIRPIFQKYDILFLYLNCVIQVSSLQAILPNLTRLQVLLNAHYIWYYFSFFSPPHIFSQKGLSQGFKILHKVLNK